MLSAMGRADWQTEEVSALRQALSAFLASEVTPGLEQWEKDRRVPRDFWLAMGRQGYLCPWVDPALGGAGADFAMSVVVCEELGRTGHMGLQTGVSVHADITAPYIDQYATAGNRERWLAGCASGEMVAAIAMTEPGVGSDLAAVATTAVRDGDQWVINGQKTFISNGMECDLVVVVARTAVDDDEKPDQATGARGLSLFVVEGGAAGFVKSRQLEKMGQHCQDTAELFFEDCRVPADNLLGEPGQGFAYLMKNLQRERLMIAVAAQVAAEQALAKTLPYVRERRAFGKSIGSFQHNAFKLVERATEIEIGRTFLDSLIDEFIAGDDITRRVSMAKWWLSDMACRVADDCVQLHGGYGYMAEYPIARDYMDVRAMPIYAGSNEVMKVILARMMDLE
jgi:acyl-CoA dehydrogenase